MPTTEPPPLLVDGNNVIGAAADGWWRDRPAAVRRLLARLLCYATNAPHHVVLVLDVPQPDLHEGDHGQVTVRYATRRGRDAADDRILELVAAHTGGDIHVVTSDRELAARVRALGATTTGAGRFLGLLEKAGC